MPPVIDEKMAQAFEQLKPPQLRTLLSSHVPPANRELTASRLTAIQEHVSLLRRTGHVVSCEDWDKNWVTLSSHFSTDNSYLGKLLQRARRQEALESESGPEPFPPEP